VKMSRVVKHQCALCDRGICRTSVSYRKDFVVVFRGNIENIFLAVIGEAGRPHNKPRAIGAKSVAVGDRRGRTDSTEAALKRHLYARDRPTEDVRYEEKRPFVFVPYCETPRTVGPQDNRRDEVPMMVYDQ